MDKFDLKKYLAEGKLYEDFPKNKWVYLTDEEKDAHAAFVQQLGENAVWNKLETKN